MFAHYETPAGTIRVPDVITAEMVAEILAAGWTAASASWRNLLDRFEAKNADGATLALEPRQNARGEWCWQVGSKYFVDNSYPEYCDHFHSLSAALAAFPI